MKGKYVLLIEKWVFFFWF